jgi:hypothetical protein
MTRFTNHTELDHMSETELHLELRQIFNALARLEKPSPEYAQATATLEEVKMALRRKAYSPKP